MRHRLAPMLLVLASACGPAHSIQVVEPRAAPLFARLLGEPLPGVPGDTAWARRAGDADRALAEGRPGESRALLAAALEALPADAPPCSLRGGLLYLRGLAARLAGAEDAAWRELEAACLDAVVPSGEEAARRRLAAQVRRLPAGSAGADSGPRHLWTWMEAPAAAPPEELVALREDAAALGGDDGAALALVAEWMEISRRRTDDVCDRGFEARRGEELRRIRAALEGLGRPELALAGRIRELVEDRRLVPGALAALAAWVDEPQHRWLRTAAMGRALGDLRARVDRVDPLLTVPLCSRYYEDLLAAMDAAETVGNRDSDATREDAERLMAAWSAAPACLDRGPVRVLTDRVVAAAGRREGGGFAVLEASGRLAGQIALAAFAGRAGDLATLLTEVEGSLQRVRQGLGNSRDERVLHASLGVLAAAADLFAGRAGDALEEAATAADLLDHLAAEPAAPDAPKLVRLAPALRGASLAALAALQGLTGQGPLAAQTLGRLDATLPGDLAALFSTLELPDHSDAVARILRAVAPVVARSWTEAILALEVAAPPGPGEEGWWAVGLDGARMVAWDLLALLAWSEAPEVAKAALARGEETAQRLVDGALDHFGVRDTGWELLAVIPMAHRAVPALAAEGADWRGVVRDLAGSLEPALERALARIPAPEGPLRFTDLFLDVLRAATEVGIGAFVTEGSDARIRLADALDRRAANYTGNMAFFLGMITGALRFPASPEAAAAAFDGAVAVATGELAGVSWLPWLVEAALRLHEGDDVAGALARVDRVLERGDRALSCGLTDPVHALLPVRMWLREVAGDPAAALRDYETFRSLAERGFHGHTSVACRLVSQRGSLIVNANVGQSLAAVLVPTGSEGSFQMGAGLSSLGRTSDEVVCWAGVPAGPRDDALLHAHLAAAWYAMRRNDEAAAHRALSDALAAGRRLLHGGEVVLGGPAAAAVEAARKAVSLELVAWVSFAARLRGHITAADHLVDLADWLLGRREETWAGVFPSDDGAPPFLRRLPGLPALGPWVRRWHVAPNPSERAALVEELLRVKALHGFLPRWGLTLVRELLRREEALAASTAPRPLSAPPRDPLATAVVGAWRWLVSMTPDTFDQAAFLDRLDALAAAGLAREVLGAVAYALSILQSGGRTASEPLLLALASDRIPAAIFPVDRALALNELGAALMRSPDLLPAILAYEEIVPVLTARIPEREELENRLRRVNLLGSAGQLPVLEEAVDSLLPMLERRYGRTGEVTWSLLSVEVALRVFGRSADSPPEETLSLLASLGDSVNGAFPARQFFRLLAAAPPGEPREALAGAYLHFMFQNGPPLQEPAPAPGSGPPPPPRG